MARVAPGETQEFGGAAEIGLPEFVMVIAAMMALTALSIDIMLPALPAIAHGLGITEPNDRQFVVTAYLIGFAAGQPLFGPLSDRFGRKPVLMAGLAIFLIGSIGAAAAPSFDLLLWSRAAQGFGAASPRIVSMAIVRDRFAGRAMARVMSFVMMVFIIVPILAPALGELILVLGPWHWVFAFMTMFGALALIWGGLRLPETRHAADRLPLSWRALGGAVRTAFSHRRSVGYTAALCFMFGNLMSYIGSSQQIFMELYGLGQLFPLAFGAIACFMALASIVNARLVGRLGMRRISHTALIGYVGVCAAMALAGYPEQPPVILFGAFLAASFFFFGLTVPNFNATAMEPLGHIAGVASSLIGCATTVAGALLGWLVGQSFDGTVRPLSIGMTAVALIALAIVLVTERGRLCLTSAAAARAGPHHS